MAFTADLRGLARASLFPWWGIESGAPGVYFGPTWKSYGGPDLKLAKLAARFGNPRRGIGVVYVASGKPPPLSFLRHARRRGARIVLNQNGVYTPAWCKGDVEAPNAVLRELHALSDYVFYQSEFCRRSCEVFVRPPQRPSEVLYNAVDVRRFVPRSSPREGGMTLLSLRYFRPGSFQTLEPLLEALAILRRDMPDCRLLLAGKSDRSEDGRTMAEILRGLGRKHGVEDALEYIGRYSAEEAPAIYRRADVFVHLKYNDACPSTVLEALASGLAVVYGCSGGTAELAGESGVGLPLPSDYERDHVPPGRAVAEAIRSAWSRRGFFAESARSRAERLFDIENWYARHAAVFQDVLRVDGGARAP